MATHTFAIDGSAAHDMRLLLNARAHQGVTWTEKQYRWLDWIIPVRFTVTAPPGVLESIMNQVDEMKTELWRDRQF